MFVRNFVFLAALVVLAPATARAQNKPPATLVARAPNPRARTGAILTTVGGSLFVTAPLVVMAGLGVVQAEGPNASLAGMGPVVFGAFVGATIGIGLLVPGLVMLATSKPHDRVVPLPETREAAWTEFRAPPSGLHAFTLPVFAGRF